MARANDDDALAAEWHQLMSRYQRLMCALDRELGAHDLSASEFEVLQQLSDAEDCSLRMTSLAESAHLSQSALSRLVTRLERDGLLARKACEHDRRAQFVALTEAGRERYAEARPTQRRVLRENGTDCLDRDGVSSERSG
ncbi:MAG TPA: MarR family transcriptional regulator [Nocardioides sp.]|nr:MarR family transcriptional regulator [Nocardioides sp.]